MRHGQRISLFSGLSIGFSIGCVLSVMGVLSKSAHASNPVSAQVGGFVDAQAQWSSSIVSGFTIPNARVWLNKEFRGGFGQISLPFAFSSTETSSNHSFSVGGPKSEAYVEYRFDSGFFGRLGQFATLFGAESLWSDQFRYTSRGLLAESLPYVHTGLLLGFGPTEMFTLRMMVANRSDFGFASTRGPDIAAKFGVKMDMIRFQIGYLLAVGNDSNARSILDVLLGASSDSLSLDLAFNLFSSPGNTGWGFHADMGFSLAESLRMSTRLNVANQIFTRTGSGPLSTTPSANLLAWTIGPQVTLTQDLSLKADYTLTSNAGTAHSAALAGVYAF